MYEENSLTKTRLKIKRNGLQLNVPWLCFYNLKSPSASCSGFHEAAFCGAKFRGTIFCEAVTSDVLYSNASSVALWNVTDLHINFVSPLNFTKKICCMTSGHVTRISTLNLPTKLTYPELYSNSTFWRILLGKVTLRDLMSRDPYGNLIYLLDLVGI